VKNTTQWLDNIQNQWVLLAEIDHKIVGFGTFKDGPF
jgi:hypothetical protein